MLAFYNWLKLQLQRIDRNFFWEEIRTALGETIREKLKKGLINESNSFIRCHNRCMNEMNENDQIHRHV